MQVTLLGFITVPIALFLSFKLNLKQLLLTTFVCSTFSATAIIIFDFIGFALTIGQLFGILLLVKLFILILKKQINYKIKVNIWIYVFILLCSISLVYPILFSRGIVVLTPDNEYLPIEFKFQMVTQFAYLLFGFFVFMATCIIYKNIKYEQNDFIYTSRLILLIFNVLLILQWLMPVDVYNKIFRALPSSNNQCLPGSGFIRLSGPTFEASILCFTLIPIIGLLLFNLNKKNWRFDLPIIIISIGLIFTTQSSTFIVGLASTIMCLIFCFRRNIINQFTKLHINKNILFIGVITVGMIVGVVCYLLFKDMINILLDKLTGQSVSGSQRTTALKHHLNIFKQYPLFGVGFGTIRSYDLLSTWLAGIGLFGVGSYLIYILSIIKNLFKHKESWMYIQFVIVMIVMMMTSIPEPYYLFFWIILGVLQMLSNDFRKVSM